jgi:exonuclease VII small subunit
MNPLDEHLEAYETAKNAIKVAKRVLDQRDNPLGNTTLGGIDAQQAHEMLDKAEEQLDKLVAFALFAAFERTLRDHLASALSPVGSSATAPAELAEKLQTYLEDGVDRWRVDHVIELFNPPAREQDVSNVKGIRTFRHHVAHGTSPPSAIPPNTAYAQLTTFLKNAGLVS